MSRSNVEDLYPLSPLQEGMLFDTLQAPRSGVYVTQSHWELRGDVEPSHVREAWLRVLQRHTVLRTSFLWKRRKLLQAVLREVPLPWTEEDWRDLPAERQERRFEAFLEADRELGFDPSKAPLMRLALHRVADDAWRLYWCYHHLILDGWSAGLVLAEVSEIFGALSRGLEPDLKPALPFRDFITWLRQQDAEATRQFWRRQLHGFREPTPLPGDLGSARRRTAAARGGPEPHEKVTVSLSAGATTALESWMRRHHLTWSVVVQGVWALLLSHYSGRRRVLFGLVVSGRPASLERYEERIGMFVNTVPVRFRVPRTARLVEWLRSYQELQGEMRAHEHVSLADLRRWSDLPRGCPFFETLVGVDNYPRVEAGLRGGGGGSGAPEVVKPGGHDQTSVPLTLAVWPTSQLTFELNGSGDRIPGAELQRMAEACRVLFTHLPEKGEHNLGELDALIATTLKEQTARAAGGREAAASSALAAARPQRQRLQQSGRLLRRTLRQEGGTPLPVLAPETEDIDLAGWVERNTDLLSGWLERYGLLLFRGFDLGGERGAERLRALLCGRAEDGPEPSADLQAAAELFVEGDPVPLHNLGASGRRPPRRLSLSCTGTPAGGELVFADTRRVFGHLDEAFRRRFEDLGLLYREEGGLEGSEARPAVLSLQKTGESLWFSEMTRWYPVPGEPGAMPAGRRQCLFGDGTEIDAATFQRVSEAYAAAESRLPLERGDLLVVDNLLTACGHSALADGAGLALSLGHEAALVGASAGVIRNDMEKTPA
ncbi:MAG: TauD/TfdA family dioxygenase [Acidobacteria bacterium]|nr:TauD/TfdA family dioxygenase [Acidobacteriota bacterium]